MDRPVRKTVAAWAWWYKTAMLVSQPCRLAMVGIDQLPGDAGWHTACPWRPLLRLARPWDI